MPANLENSAVATGLVKVTFHSNQRKTAIPKSVQTTAQLQLISHISKVMLKILQTRLQTYMNWELPDVQDGLRKSRGTRDQIINTCWIIEKASELQKNIYFCFIDYANAFDCVDHNKTREILQGMGISDHFTCLLRNLLYASQEATVRTGHGTRLLQNREKSMPRLYTVTLLILMYM